MGCWEPDSRYTSQTVSNRRGSMLIWSSLRQSRRKWLSWASTDESYWPSTLKVALIDSWLCAW